MREKLIQAKKLIEELLQDLDLQNQKEDVIKEEMPKEAKSNFIRTEEFEILNKLLNSEDWPEAVFASQIADENSEADKEERAEGICDIILPPLENKKFLDFGCGEGHVSKYMSKNSAFSVGFDIKKDPRSKLNWEEVQDNFLLTTDFEKVKSNAPYDAVLLYDVMDHTEGESNVEMLLKIKPLLSENAKIFVRCHPWAGRHGGHIYKKINKAFIHLVFSEDELKELGVENFDYNHKVLYPIKSYTEVFEKAGFEKNNQEVDTQEVESFFGSNNLVKSRIMKSFGITSWGEDPPRFQMSQCFLDFVLTPKQ